MSDNPAQPKKHWWNNLADAYRITKRSYPWVPFALLAAGLIPLAACIAVGVFAGRLVLWLILGATLAVMLPTMLLTTLTRKAAYAQIDGMPGASAAVLESMRGWNYSTEPVRFSRNQDFVFRLVGRPGVVLIAEGPKSRVGKLVQQERLAIQRSAGKEVPITVVYVGDGENGTTKLADVERTLKRLPKSITKEEVAALANRLDRTRSADLPIPKGIDPNRIRPSRRALRG